MPQKANEDMDTDQDKTGDEHNMNSRMRRNSGSNRGGKRRRISEC